MQLYLMTEAYSHRQNNSKNLPLDDNRVVFALLCLTFVTFVFFLMSNMCIGAVTVEKHWSKPEHKQNTHTLSCGHHSGEEMRKHFSSSRGEKAPRHHDLNFLLIWSSHCVHFYWRTIWNLFNRIADNVLESTKIVPIALVLMPCPKIQRVSIKVHASLLQDGLLFKTWETCCCRQELETQPSS